MKTTGSVVAVGTVALALLTCAADAKPLHRHRHHVSVRHVYGYATYGAAGPIGYGGPFVGYIPVVYGAGYPSFGQAYEGQIVEQAAIRAQHEPGFTSELEPSAKQTATGGPVGGIPEHSNR